jgi:AcrR family transcriptional regulator
MSDLSPRRQQLMLAATRVVAGHGLRGLTHRAVDREAGVSEGSSSAYYRTRQALQEGLAQYVASAAAGDVTALTDDLRSSGADDDRKVELTSRLFLRWIGERDVLLARLELELAATRDPSLASVLAGWRRRLVGIVASIMSDRGVADAERQAEVLVAALDGVLLGALLRPARSRKTFVTGSLERLMGGLAGPTEPSRGAAAP